jgi:hypothetical protein
VRGARLFLIWSLEHDAWWAAGEIGYTRRLREAGRYPEARARKILKRANRRVVNECVIPVACVDEELGIALEESVKLQSHYATLLNMHDGGARRPFADAQAWLARLRETGTIR